MKLSEQLRINTNLELLHISLCTGSNSSRLRKQLNSTDTNNSEQNSSKQHSKFSPPNSRVDHCEQLSDILKITGAMLYNSLGTSFTYIVIGKGWYGSVVERSLSWVWVLVSSISQDSESVSIDQTLKECGQIIEYLNSTLLQSTSAALCGSARSGDFLPLLPTPQGIIPLGRATVPTFVASEHAVECVWMPPFAWKQCGL